MGETKTYTLEDLEKMPKADAELILAKAVKIEGTAVVKRADGTIKYDEPEMRGSYGESEQT